MKWLLAIMALSFTDTFNTLYILSHGGTEVNPFMDMLLEMGTGYFVAGKNIVTLLGLWVLTKYKKYAILNTIIIIYSILLIYQLYLILIIKGIL